MARRRTSERHIQHPAVPPHYPADVGCQHALALLHLYAERELDDRDAADHYAGIAAHLAACTPCAEDLRGLLALLTAP